MDRNLPATLFRFATISPLSDVEFEGVAATDGLKDDGYQLDMAGGDISRFKDGKGALLLSHDKDRIIGTATLRKTSRALMLPSRATVRPVLDTNSVSTMISCSPDRTRRNSSSNSLRR